MYTFRTDKKGSNELAVKIFGIPLQLDGWVYSWVTSFGTGEVFYVCDPWGEGGLFGDC